MQEVLTCRITSDPPVPPPVFSHTLPRRHRHPKLDPNAAATQQKSKPRNNAQSVKAYLYSNNNNFIWRLSYYWGFQPFLHHSASLPLPTLRPNPFIPDWSSSVSPVPLNYAPGLRLKIFFFDLGPQSLPEISHYDCAGVNCTQKSRQRGAH